MCAAGAAVGVGTDAAMAVAAAGLHATTVLQQRQQVLLTAWLHELLVSVQRELVERDELQHMLREMMQQQDEHRVAVLCRCPSTAREAGRAGAGGAR